MLVTNEEPIKENDAEDEVPVQRSQDFSSSKPIENNTDELDEPGITEEITPAEEPI